MRPRVLVESGAPHTLTALASAGRGIAIVPTNVRVARAGVRIAPILLRGRPLGGSMGISWDPRHFLPAYAENFIEELIASTKRSYPGREFKLDRFRGVRVKTRIRVPNGTRKTLTDRQDDLGAEVLPLKPVPL
jgi:hypothetical protein